MSDWPWSPGRPRYTDPGVMDALAMCAACPVSRECGEYAESERLTGLWAGAWYEGGKRCRKLRGPVLTRERQRAARRAAPRSSGAETEGLVLSDGTPVTVGMRVVRTMGAKRGQHVTVIGGNRPGGDPRYVRVKTDDGRSEWATVGWLAARGDE